RSKRDWSSDVCSSDLHYNEENHTVSWRFRVWCGKGTYVRTLAVGLGSKLGFPAHMSQLTRIKSGPFEAKECVTLDEIRQLMEEEIGRASCRERERGVE